MTDDEKLSYPLLRVPKMKLTWFWTYVLLAQLFYIRYAHCGKISGLLPRLSGRRALLIHLAVVDHVVIEY